MSEKSLEKDVDRISTLPDDILWLILSLLSSRDAVRCGILSTKWKNLWAGVENLDIDNGFMKRVEGYDKMNMSRNTLLNYVNKMIKKREEFSCIKRIRLFYRGNLIQDIPKGLFISTLLEELKLNIDNAKLPTTIRLPNLKTLHLTISKYCMSRCLEGFLSGCPCIEELHIKRRCVRRYDSKKLELSIQIPTLKKFEMELVVWDKEQRWPDVAHSLTINAPRLEYLRLRDYQTGYFSVIDLSSLLHAYVDWEPSYNKYYFDTTRIMELECQIFRLFEGFTTVKSLSLSKNTVRWLEEISWWIISGWIKARVPTFNSLMKLELNVAETLDYKFMGMFFSHTPNLETLILINQDQAQVEADTIFGSGRWIPPDNVPECLLFRLKDIIGEGLHRDFEVKAIRYLLQQSRVLNRLRINFRSFEIRNMFQDILGAPRPEKSHCKFRSHEEDHLPFFIGH